MSPEDMAAIHARAMTRPRPWSAAEIRDLLGLPGAFACDVAQGFALGRVTLDEAELLTIAVAPEAQGQGAGSRCLARFEEAARARGADAAFLEVAADNGAARALYARAGYAQVGVRRGYYVGADGSACDALVLRRGLGR